MIKDTIENMLKNYTNKEIFPEEWDWEGLKSHLQQVFSIQLNINQDGYERYYGHTNMTVKYGGGRNPDNGTVPGKKPL